MIVGIGLEPWPVNYYEELTKTAREAASTVVDKTIRKLNEASDKTLKISHEIISGPASQVIVDEAERWGADLIVMGSRGLGAWNRLLLGSVSSVVVHHAKCSVEIVRTARPE
jgi:nucleotide-binding universal stress UspA family protein